MVFADRVRQRQLRVVAAVGFGGECSGISRAGAIVKAQGTFEQNGIAQRRLVGRLYSNDDVLNGTYLQVSSGTVKLQNRIGVIGH